jgi:uncharacterized RDD family membrane protein YckC
MTGLSVAPAGLWVRVKAFALDYLLIAGYLILVVALGVGINIANPAFTQRLFANRITGQVISFLLVTLPITLYFALSESSPRQAAWGKGKMGLRVIRVDGTRLSFARSLGRTALKFIPWELSHTLIWQLRFSTPAREGWSNAGFIFVWLLIAVYLLSLWLSKSHQALYDRLVGTYVVVA